MDETTETPEVPQPVTEEEAARERVKISNDDRKRERLIRQVNRAHDWRVQVWAQMELKIRQDNASLQVLGVQPIIPFEPRFGDDEMLHHYSTMSLSK